MDDGDWDDFICAVWDTNYDVNSMPRAEQIISSASMDSKPICKTVNEWSTRVDLLFLDIPAVKAPSAEKARVFLKGLTDKIVAKGSSIAPPPPEGFLKKSTVVAWAQVAERALLAEEFRAEARKREAPTVTKNVNVSKAPKLVADSFPSQYKPPGPAQSKVFGQRKSSNSGVKPAGTPTGILYKVNRDGRLKNHPGITKYRRDHALCVRCGQPDHGTSLCPPSRKIDPNYEKTVPIDFVIAERSFRAVLDVNSRVDKNDAVTVDIYSHPEDVHLGTSTVFLDTGADVSYVTPEVADKYAIEQRDHQHPYRPRGADGSLFQWVTRRAQLKIGFGSHVELVVFDIMDLGGMNIVLGKDWMKIHDPILQESSNFYPVFDHEDCKHHTMGNTHVTGGNFYRIHENPRAFRQVKPFFVISSSLSDVHTSGTNVRIPSPIVAESHQMTPDTPSAGVVRPQVNLHPLTVDDDVKESVPHPSSTPLVANKIKRKNRVITTSSIQNQDKSKCILVIRSSDAVVHVVSDIQHGHSPEDKYFATYVYPVSKPVSLNTVTKESTSARVSEVVIPPEYADLAAAFSDGTESLPEHGPFDMDINLVDGKIPPMGPLYQMSESEMKIVQKYVTDMTAKGLIQPSKSPCGAPILFAKKKDGTLRLCVDYRRLNDVTVKSTYPLPLIDEMLDRIRSAKIFTALDLKDAYWLVRIKKGDEWKTAFRTRYGLFEYLVMPFGLSNCPGNFQSKVNRTFADMLDIFVQIYLDDFLIYSLSYTEHVTHVRQVLQRVIDEKLSVNLKKCTFHTTKVQFLGYEVTPDGVHMCPDRVEAIRNWEPPTNLKALQSFLGFCNFYCSFIRGYSSIVTPLTDMTRKNTPWRWDTSLQSAFDATKEAFISADVCRHFNPDLPIILETDASDFAISGVLSQVHSDGIHPVGFLSRKLQPAELNYDTHDKELLAIIESLKGWRHYTMETSTPFHILTDHNNLKYFMTSKSLN
jgi:hypothetical protein